MDHPQELQRVKTLGGKKEYCIYKEGKSEKDAVAAEANGLTFQRPRRYGKIARGTEAQFHMAIFHYPINCVQRGSRDSLSRAEGTHAFGAVCRMGKDPWPFTVVA